MKYYLKKHKERGVFMLFFFTFFQLKIHQVLARGSYVGQTRAGLLMIKPEQKLIVILQNPRVKMKGFVFNFRNLALDFFIYLCYIIFSLQIKSIARKWEVLLRNIITVGKATCLYLDSSNLGAT